MKTKNIFALILIICTFTSCLNDLSLNLWEFREDSWLRLTVPVPEYVKPQIEGIYEVTDGSDFFGSEVVLKWSDTLLTVYTGIDFLFMALKTGYNDTSFIFEGYWRNSLDLTTGLARLTIKDSEGGRDLICGLKEPKSIIFRGSYDNNLTYPMKPLILKLKKKLKSEDDIFYIIAHRGGGRTSDMLPSSENSLGMLRLAPQFGANAVEIDVRLTKDGVPILYHDDYFTPRLINSDYIIGLLSDYTYKQIRTFCTLKDGSLVPTLREALDVVLYETDIALVWIDTKALNLIDKLITIQDEYKVKAQQAGRNLDVLIGLPENEIFNEFISNPNHVKAGAICEIGIDEAIESGSEYWAPRWTVGLQYDNIKKAHDNNIKVLNWTLDNSEFMNKFISEGVLNGVLTNYPYRVAFEYYYWRNKTN